MTDNEWFHVSECKLHNDQTVHQNVSYLRISDQTSTKFDYSYLPKPVTEDLYCPAYFLLDFDNSHDVEPTNPPHVFLKSLHYEVPVYKQGASWDRGARQGFYADARESMKVTNLWAQLMNFSITTVYDNKMGGIFKPTPGLRDLDSQLYLCGIHLFSQGMKPQQNTVIIKHSIVSGIFNEPFGKVTLDNVTNPSTKLSRTIFFQAAHYELVNMDLVNMSVDQSDLFKDPTWSCAPDAESCGSVVPSYRYCMSYKYDHEIDPDDPKYVKVPSVHLKNTTVSKDTPLLWNCPGDKDVAPNKPQRITVIISGSDGGYGELNRIAGHVNGTSGEMGKDDKVTGAKYIDVDVSNADLEGEACVQVQGKYRKQICEQLDKRTYGKILNEEEDCQCPKAPTPMMTLEPLSPSIHDSDGSFSAGAIAGIALGGLALLALLCGILILAVVARRRRANRQVRVAVAVSPASTGSRSPGVMIGAGVRMSASPVQRGVSPFALPVKRGVSPLALGVSVGGTSPMAAYTATGGVDLMAGPVKKTVSPATQRRRGMSSRRQSTQRTRSALRGEVNSRTSSIKRRSSMQRRRR